MGNLETFEIFTACILGSSTYCIFENIPNISDFPQNIVGFIILCFVFSDIHAFH
jgi:hypothetical protein